MKPSWRFALLVVVISTGLFVLWPGISTAYRSIAGGLGNVLRAAVGKAPVEFLTEKDSYLLIPALAVILAAQGFGWRRKLTFVGVAAAGLVLFGAVITLFEAGSRPVAIAGGSDVSHLPFLLFGVVFPIALVVAFVGSSPTLLWSAAPGGTGAVRCPVCGARPTDMRHHVVTAHGREALGRGDVKRALRG